MKQLDNWHKTKLSLLIFGLVELLITYGFASLAIDRGTWWWYVLTLVLLVGALQNFIKLIGKLFHGNKASKA